MIIQALMDMLYGLLDWITSPFNIPMLPPEVNQVLSTLLDYLKIGFGILANYTHLDYLFVLFGIIVAFDVAIFGYKIIMWVLRKIPMLGIE